MFGGVMFGAGARFGFLAVIVLLSACGRPEPMAGHGEMASLVFETNPDPDPEVMAWAGCLDTVMNCMDGGGELQACVTVDACGADCVGALAAQLAGVDDIEARLDVFESVFVSEDAVCRPPDPEAGG